VEVLNHQHVHRPYKQDIELAFLIFDIEIELAQVESDPLANARKRVVAIKNHSCTEMMVASKVRVVSGALAPLRAPEARGAGGTAAVVEHGGGQRGRASSGPGQRIGETYGEALVRKEHQRFCSLPNAVQAST
jgi:hypothetical protein